MSFISIDAMTPLANDFVPGSMDVVCCRGRAIRKHEGNVNFRRVVNSNLERYSKAKSKLEKSLIVSSIVDTIRQKSPDGGFVKEKSGMWYEIGDHLAREKVGQCLRDSLSSQYRSSSKAKKRRRNEDMAKLDDEVDEFVRSNCKEVIESIKVVSVQACSDAEAQIIFNQANCRLLHLFKENEERARKRRITTTNENINGSTWKLFNQVNMLASSNIIYETQKNSSRF